MEQKSIIPALTRSVCTVSVQGAYFIRQILFVIRLSQMLAGSTAIAGVRIRHDPMCCVNVRFLLVIGKESNGNNLWVTDK